METRRCPKCETVKPRTAFYKHPVYCKTCVSKNGKERRAAFTPEQRERMLKQRRDWWSAQTLEYRREHNKKQNKARDEARAVSAAYFAAHPGKYPPGQGLT